MARVNFAGLRMRLPGHPLLRVPLGGLLVAGGILGFLPALGFWMVPLGLLILSVDLPLVRRWTRVGNVRLGRALQRRWPGLARRMGFRPGRPDRDLKTR